MEALSYIATGKFYEGVKSTTKVCTVVVIHFSSPVTSMLGVVIILHPSSYFAHKLAFQSSLKPLDQIKINLVGMFIDHPVQSLCFYSIWNPQQKKETPRCQRRMFSVFVCGKFIFQLIIFFIYSSNRFWESLTIFKI